MLGGIGAMELLVILAILTLLFGVGKLAKLGRGLGEGIRFFKEGLHGVAGDGDGSALPSRDGGPPSLRGRV